MLDAEVARPAIFVGGMGRSGTSILRTLLDSHREVYALPLETRFIVDSDGLYDLFRNLTHDYSLVRGRDALVRFERMMRLHMAGPGLSPYAGYDLPSVCGADVYWRELDGLVDDLTSITFYGADLSVNQSPEPRLVTWARTLDRVQRRIRGAERPLPAPAVPRSELRYAPYYGDPSELIDRLGRYVDALFSAAALRHGKSGYCEKTPHNSLHAPFLLRLVPRATFVHIVRDPRAVVRSLMKQRWAPDTAAACCRFAEDHFERWFDVRDDPMLRGERFFELRLEDLTADTGSTLEWLTSAIGLGMDFDQLPEIRPAHAEDWRRGLTPADVELIERRMQPIIERLPRAGSDVSGVNP